MQPIIWEDEEGNSGKERRTHLLSDWNYHESDNFIFLFWPSRFDFMQAFLLKMLNRTYYPEILNRVYVCAKGGKPVFRRLALHEQVPIAPRMGCSCYELDGKVFIFGGFYGREKNYLELQHDITTFDIRQLEQAPNKLVLDNIKGRLYGPQVVADKMQRNEKLNSFVRARLEFEFFDRAEIFREEFEEEGVKKVLMMGGYGQNFVRPYSLLTYYYYQLDFNVAQRDLVGIQRRIIYNKAVPINLRSMTKNLGVIKTNRKTKNGTLDPKKLTEPDSYTLYRNVFRGEVKDGEEEFNYKFKYMFSEDESKNYKHEIKKIQELRAEEFDSSSITIERDPKNNHIVGLEKDGKKRWVTLRMEIPPERAKKLEGSPREVSLTHESIIYLDIWNSMICALVKHEKYVNLRKDRLWVEVCWLSTTPSAWRGSTSSRTCCSRWRWGGCESSTATSPSTCCSSATRTQSPSSTATASPPLPLSRSSW